MLCEKAQCTGCLACYNACAFHAIQLKKDDLGVVYPQIDAELCRKCGKCAAACPVLHPPKAGRSLEAIALYTKNEKDRKTCASGGVATTLYREVLRNGGVAFGTGFAIDGMPCLKVIETEEDLEKAKGSKYVYAFPGLIYREVELQLKTGKQCLFVGTPCQVAGLRSFLKKEWDNLLAIDLICHGTPPQDYLKEHLQSKSKGKAVAGVKFRGEQGFWLLAQTETGTPAYSKKFDEDIYFISFLRGLTYREICYSCPYACEKRVGDITIGDFWGIASDAMHGYKGRISAALPNTEKGKAFLQECKSSFEYETRTVEEAIKGNAQLRQPTIPHTQRDVFTSVYQETGSFERAIDATVITRLVKKACIRNRILWLPRWVKHKLLKKGKR